MIRRMVQYAVIGVLLVTIAGVSAYFTVLFFIKGEDRVIVPDLAGKDALQVLESLNRLGLNPKVKGSEYSDHMPANHVISQEPIPGTEIKKGRDVRILLSKGPKIILAPNLKGLPMRQAGIILDQNGLCIGGIAKVHHNSAIKETVMAQFPEKGTALTREQCVDLLISLGPRSEAFKMPDMTGLAFPEATRIIRRMNLVSGSVEYRDTEVHSEDVILEQDPPAGHPVFEDSRIKLVQSRRAIGRRNSAAFVSKGVGLFKYRLKEGFLRSRIRLEINAFGFSGDLMDEYFEPGEEIVILLPEGVEASIRLYEDDALVAWQEYIP